MTHGFDNDVVYCTNFDFSGNDPVSAQMTLDGEMLFGNTATGRPTVGTPTAANGLTYAGSGGGATWGLDLSTVDNGTLPVAYGGTGVAAVTQYSVVCGGATADTDPLQVVSGVGTAGQVLTSAGAGALPTWSNNVAVTWQEYSSTPQTADVNRGYYCSFAGTVVITLPAASAQFDVITVQANDQAASFQIAQGAGQQIFMLGSSTTLGAGGTLTCAQAGSKVTLLCVTANLTWRVIEVLGNVTLA